MKCQNSVLSWVWQHLLQGWQNLARVRHLVKHYSVGWEHVFTGLCEVYSAFSCKIFGLELFRSPRISRKNSEMWSVSLVMPADRPPAKRALWKWPGHLWLKHKLSVAFWLGKWLVLISVCTLEISKRVCNNFHLGKTHPSCHQPWTGHLLSKIEIKSLPNFHVIQTQITREG